MSAAVAIGVVSWNTRELLRDCLTSLRADADAGRAEVWVVDNGSTDGSPAMVRDDFPWVSLLERPDNPGYGPAVNLVARATSTPFVAPANSDLVFEPDALRTLLDAAQRTPDDGAFAPRLVLPDGATQHSVHPFPTLPRLAAFNLGLQRVVPGLGDRLGLEGYWTPERERRVDWAHGAFLLVRREAWDAIDGFDDDQWMYAEDLDLGWRLARAGFPTRYVPGARVGHMVSQSTTQAFGDARVQRAQDATYAWLARRRGATVARAAAAVNVGGAVTRVAWMTPLARARPRRWAGARAANATWARIHARGLRDPGSLDRR
ncbi:glycosyltransferase family 2 protein [Conexibacter sp. SYSU D00693]|uniref:glycosyltransferase family 2 protein n=1 Tax=Conexibacter sp. SYSU D00693 TaxID=2812560 RepID=UPI00196A9399|nr:glycosyltransferase family 2 protein [Conexibacter sp. SYSU D00693]